jgi:hypothetical protein
MVVSVARAIIGRLEIGHEEARQCVTPVFSKKTECISYVCQDHNFTHMIDSRV